MDEVRPGQPTQADPSPALTSIIHFCSAESVSLLIGTAGDLAAVVSYSGDKILEAWALLMS
jgi:hypothetical protein